VSEEMLATIHQAHRELFDRLLAVTEGLSDDDWATATGCPGWDVRDQLAHCVGLERRLLGDPGPEVAVPELPHLTDEMSRAMEVDVEARRQTPGQQLRDEAMETFSRRLRDLADLQPEELDQRFVGPAGMEGKGSTMLRLRVFDLCAHEQDIRRALARGLEPEGAHGQLVGQQVLRGWSRLWPERLAGPGAVEVEVTGPQPTAVRVELDEGDGPQRVARLRGSWSQLLPVACGRTDAPDVTQLLVDGDPALAAEAVRAGAMTP
jgi:uncharacterized protein (TIGR03083 family)